MKSGYHPNSSSFDGGVPPAVANVPAGGEGGWFWKRRSFSNKKKYIYNGTMSGSACVYESLN